MLLRTSNSPPPPSPQPEVARSVSENFGNESPVRQPIRNLNGSHCSETSRGNLTARGGTPVAKTEDLSNLKSVIRTFRAFSNAESISTELWGIGWLFGFG